MQLKKLTIHNIASIEDAVIDFSGQILGKAPIFLICGETGAGKTTILDAICLALYGDTPRMTSVSKEELELSEPSDTRLERYYSNDNSQLLHRGAGEGFAKLLFTGNDERDYEALWEVHRAHNKAHKRLMRPTRMLTATDGGYSENRLNEIRAKIIELTGLDYDQFCRTVMLAQGEFTKFLKSNKVEKSEILEKLTGTEIYSRLGIKIAERYNEAKSSCQELKAEIERTSVLSPEDLEAMKLRQEEIRKYVEASTAELSGLTSKLSWLMADSKNKESFEKIKGAVALLEESIKSESFISDKILVNDYDLSGEGRGVVANLSKNEKSIQQKRDSIPMLKIALDKAKEAEGKKQSVKSELEGKVNEKEEEIEKADLEGIAKRYDALIKEDNMLSLLLTRLEKMKGEEKSVSILKDQIKEYRDRRDQNRKKAEGLESQIAESSKALKSWTEKLDKAEVSVSDMVKDIRSRLREGDICPVCGSMVDKDIDEEYFDALLSPIRESKKEAEEVYRQHKSSHEAALKLATEDSKALKKLETSSAKAEEALKKTSEETESMIRQAGFESQELQAVEESCQNRRNSIKEETNILNEKQKAAESIRKELKKLKTQLKDATSEADKAHEELSKIELSLKERDAEIKALESAKEEMWEELRLFFIKNPTITMQRIKELSAHDKDEMLALKQRLTEAEDNFKLEKGKLEAIKVRMEEHAATRPEMGEEDSQESLEKRKEEIEKGVRNLSEENGRLTETLERDAKLRKEAAILQAKYEKMREVYDRWEGLYNKLGDLKGAKFRSIAQSFILRSLLENANLYMRRFNDRYTLTCNPGTLAILVKDDYKPSEPQPASILSGGESFMASLSLALALSNLRSGGATADILFIDEGFGTLSGEYLGNVMDTLERLHQIGGRKVGLISHVMEMKERIPVQIRVQRESPALSKIEVIENY